MRYNNIQLNFSIDFHLNDSDRPSVWMWHLKPSQLCLNHKVSSAYYTILLLLYTIISYEYLVCLTLRSHQNWHTWYYFETKMHIKYVIVIGPMDPNSGTAGSLYGCHHVRFHIHSKFVWTRAEIFKCSAWWLIKRSDFFYLWLIVLINYLW